MKQHWGHGYATEVVTALLRYAFEELDLNRIYAHHMVRNPASGRVMEKAGFLLDNNQGDKVSFRKAENSVVVDNRAEKKAEKWEDLKNGLWVSVCWKCTDKPRLAYKVTVQDPPSDAAKDE